MRNLRLIGFGAAIGIIVGTVIFAVTEQPAWLAVGLVFGAAIGAAAQRLGVQLPGNED